jgi:hypothetical protein
MNLKGESPQGFRPPQRQKRKRTNQHMDNGASTSLESPNYLSVLSDSEPDSESTESTPPITSRKERVPPTVIYSYLNNHTQTLKALNEKLSSPVAIKTKLNRLLLYTKTEADYEVLLREIQQAKLAYHTYPLPHTRQPRVTLKRLPPNVTTEEITAELNHHNLQANNIRQIVWKDKATAKILVKYPVFIVTFKVGTDHRDIYKTTKLCHCIVHWERYKASVQYNSVSVAKNLDIPQCIADDLSDVLNVTRIMQPKTATSFLQNRQLV